MTLSFYRIKHLWIIVFLAVWVQPLVAQPQTATSINSGKQTLRVWENKGQVRDQNGNDRPDVRFLAETPGLNVQFKQHGISYDLYEPIEANTPENPDTTFAYRFQRIDITFEGAMPDVALTSSGPSADYNNYYRGAANEYREVRSYDAVTYTNVYPHIDFVFYAEQRGDQSALKFDIVVKEGGNLANVRFDVRGADKMYLDENGALVYEAGARTLTESIPRSYLRSANTGSILRDVECSYKIEGTTVTFHASPLQKGYELVVDPQIVWGTYFGGSSDDRGYRMDRYDQNYFVVCGRTSSSNGIATSGAYQTVWNGGDDGFIQKFNYNGQRSWGTYFGAPAKEASHAIDVNSNGDIFLAGESETQTGLATPGSFQPTNGGGRDAFLAKFNAAGQLLWSTYMGGMNSEEVFGVIGTDNGNVFITGRTESTNYPYSPGAHQTVRGGGDDCFIAGFSSTGARLWSTYFGGSGKDRGLAIHELPGGDLVIFGETGSTSGIAFGSVYQTTYGGGALDGLIARWTQAGQRVWATYYGGSGEDIIRDGAIDNSGNLFFAGQTESTTNIASPGASQTIFAGTRDAMIGMLDQNGQRQWGTYFGGPDYDQGYGIDVAFSRVFVTGETYSTTGVASVGSYQPTRNGPTDGFIAEYESTGAKLCSSYFGGNYGEGIVDVLGLAPSEFLFVGSTNSTSGITTPGSHQPTSAGGIEAILARLINDCGANPELRILYLDKSLCAGEAVQLTGSASGGTPPYSYSWTPAAGLSATDIANPIASPLVTTTYIVTVTDMNNNTVKDTVTVTVHPRPTVDAGNDTTVCANATATLHGSVSGGTPPYNIQWFPTNGVQNPSSLITLVIPSSTTTYFLTITDDNGCVVTDTVTVNVRNPLNVSAGPDRVICKGNGTTLSGTVNGAVPPLQWQWSPQMGLSDPNSPTTDANPSQTTTYYLTVTDSLGCTGHDTVEVVVSEMSVDAGPDLALCNNQTGTLAGNITGGIQPHSVQWFPPGPLSNPASLITQVSVSATTMFILQVADSLGCIATDTVLVTLLEELDVDAGPDASLCSGSQAQLLGSAANGVLPYVWKWTPATGLSATNIPDPWASPSVTTEYILTVTDSNGCTGSDTVVVVVGNSLNVDAGNDITICGGGSASIGRSVSGGTAPYTYTWSPSQGLTTTTALHTEASPSQTTKYILSVTDANGCSGVDTVEVAIVDGIAVDAGPDAVLCFGEGVVIGNLPTTGAPPFSIIWTPAAGLSNPTIGRPTASPTVTTTYVVTVSDKNGCMAVDSVLVTVGPEFNVSAGPDKYYCYGSSTILEGSASGGVPPYTYSWQPGIALSSRTIAQPVANPLTDMDYILCVTDNLGCTRCDTVRVHVGSKFTVDAGSDRYLCTAGPVQLRANITGGTSPFTFTWSPSDGLSSTTGVSVQASPTQTTTYIVTVMDRSGCTGSDTVTVYVNEEIDFDAGPDASACSGDSATIGREAGFGNGPYSYTWEPPTGLGNPASAVTTAAPAVTTTYIVTVTDANGCSGKDTVTVSVYEGPSIDADDTRILCAGDTTQLNVSVQGGTSPYSYSWTPTTYLSDASIADPLAWPPVTTKYTVQVTDANGCTAYDTVLVVVEDLPVVDITPGGVITLCEGDSVTLAASQGAFTYEWSTGDTTASIVVKQGGVYHVRVTNAAGCTAVSAEVRVDVLPGLMPEIIGPIQLCGRDSIAYRVEPPNMDSYQWTIIGGTIIDGNGTDNILVSWDESVQTGVLEVVVGYGPCQGRDTLEVTIGDALHPGVAYDGKTVLCHGSGLVLRTEDGFRRYLWSTGETGTSITVDEPGLYYVWVEDSMGCNGYSDTVVVSATLVPGVEITGDTLLCGESETVLSVADGYASYTWSTGANGDHITVSQPGKYSVTAVDSNGCTTYDEVTVLMGEGLNPEIIGDTVFCSSRGGSLRVNGTYSQYLWSTGSTSMYITLKDAGLYWVKVWDDNGCAGIDSVFVTSVQWIPARLSSPDIHADPGDEVVLQLLVTIPDTAGVIESGFEGKIAFHRSVFQPTSHSYEDKEGTRYVSFSGNYAGGSAVLVEIVGFATLGSVDQANIQLAEFSWDYQCIGQQFVGGFIVINICEEGGRRLVTARPPEVQATISPNPFTGQTQIRYTLAQPSNVELVVKDILGRTVATLVQSYQGSGDYSATFNAAAMPSGMYLYILRTDYGILTGAMRSVK